MSTLKNIGIPLALISSAIAGCNNKPGSEPVRKDVSAPTAIEKTTQEEVRRVIGSSEEIVSGYPDGTFQPSQPINRAELSAKDQLMVKMNRSIQRIRNEFISEAEMLGDLSLGEIQDKLDAEETILWNASTPDLKHSSLTYDSLTDYQRAIVDLCVSEKRHLDTSKLSVEDIHYFSVAQDIMSTKEDSTAEVER